MIGLLFSDPLSYFVLFNGQIQAIGTDIIELIYFNATMLNFSEYSDIWHVLGDVVIYRRPFRTSFRVGLVIVVIFSCCLSDNAFISPSSLKYSLAVYSILG